MCITWIGKPETIYYLKKLYQTVKNGWNVDSKSLTNTVFIEVDMAKTTGWVCQWLHVSANYSL